MSAKFVKKEIVRLIPEKLKYEINSDLNDHYSSKEKKAFENYLI